MTSATLSTTSSVPNGAPTTEAPHHVKRNTQNARSIAGLNYFTKRVGAESATQLQVGTPFDYEQQMKLFVARKMPDPRDAGYREDSAGVVWHQHFSRDELLDLAGPGFKLEAERYGGLLLMPLGDLMRWPFYRLKLYRNPILRLIDRTIAWDLSIDYGRASFTILLVMRKPHPSA